VAEAGGSVWQTPLAAGLAWYIAHTLLGHHQPFFAPTAAAVSLSKVRVLRGQRALQLIVGVVLGIGIGTAVKAVAGPPTGASGAIAIGVATLIALVAALVLGGGLFEQGVLFVNQSAGSAILMITVAGAATSSERLFDALIGGGVTLVITVLLFPVAPLPLIQRAVRQVLAELRDTLARLAELADTDQTPEPGWVLATGQRIHRELAGLQQAEFNARQVASFSPRRWPQRSRVRRAGEQAEPLHLVATTVLSLTHASMAAPDVEQGLPPAQRQALHELASAFTTLAQGGDTARAAEHVTQARCLATQAVPTQTVPTQTVPTGGVRSQLIARLIQTCADDTLPLTTHGSQIPGPGE
jgi:uncharacterized membrane protein YgaE (UPF0421/DUF939 family)